MRAIVYDSFGGADVLQLSDIDSPRPSKSDVLVDVKYAGVNPIDWKIREGHFDGMLEFKFPLVPGWDLAGIVSEVGSDVKNFKPGDEVYAMAVSQPIGTGTYAEQTLVSDSCCSMKPKSVSMAEASGIPLGLICVAYSILIPHESPFPNND